MLWLKKRNGKNLKNKYQQRRAKLKCSIDKNAVLLKKKLFLPLYSTKSYYWKVFSSVLNNISEKIALMNLCLITWADLSFLLRRTILLQTKTNTYHFRPINTLKMKMPPLSSIINHKHRTRYMCFYVYSHNKIFDWISCLK